MLDTYLEFAGTSCPFGSVCGSGFSRFHTATGSCSPSILNPYCVSSLADLTPDPYEFFPFNCDLPRNSTGTPINFAYYEHPTNCIGFNSVSTSTNTVSITFEIICNEIQPDPNCLDGGGYGFSSGAVTLTIPENLIDASTPNLTLGGDCGCTPLFN